MRYISEFLVFSIAFSLISINAEAYVGPGMGAGVVASVLGIVASVFLALFAIIYYPIKRALRKRRDKILRDDSKANNSTNGS